MNDTIVATGEVPPLCSFLPEETTSITTKKMLTSVALSSKEVTPSTLEVHYTTERVASEGELINKGNVAFIFR